MKKYLIAGNWKMNKTNSQGRKFLEELVNLDINENVEVLVCPPYVMLADLKKIAADKIKIGAQNLYFEEKGAYTGEVSVEMLEDIGLDYVLVGHSERRSLFGESDDVVNKKLAAALKSEVTPVLCLGETLEDRKANKHFVFVKESLTQSLKDIEIKSSADIVVAYEPVWAIGTGENAEASDAEEMLAFIKKELVKMYGSIGSDIRLLYGGSVKPENIKAFLDEKSIDGALIGGASLEVESFSKMINFGELHG